MALFLVAGCLWLAPRQEMDTGCDEHFEECAAVSGCLNVHAKVVFGFVWRIDKFGVAGGNSGF